MRIETNIGEVSKSMRRYVDQELPYIISSTMNNSLYESKEAVKDYMDNGGIEGGATRFTKQSMRWKKASKDDHEIVLWIGKDKDYLLPLMNSGEKKNRKRSGSKLAEPPKGDYSALNRYGNFPRRYVKRLAEKANQEQQAKKRRRKNSKTYFFMRTKSGVFGIFERRNKDIRLAIYLGRESYQQRKTFEPRSVAIDTYLRGYQRLLAKNAVRALKSGLQRDLRRMRR